tara:strand:+ start:72 stop:749 length:678 start_codon:yes stop_codon:yes gene_type:complete
MGFFGTSKKLSKFDSFEKDNIESFIHKASLSINSKKNITFHYDLNSKDKNLEKEESYSEVRFDLMQKTDHYNTDLISYNILKSNKMVKQLNFAKFSTTKFISGDFATFYISLKDEPVMDSHPYDFRLGLGIKYHTKYNEFGYLPQVNKWGVHRDYLLYSYFDYSPLGTTKTKLKNGKTKIYKWKKSKGTREIEYEQYKNETGRGLEDVQKYFDDKRKQLVKLMNK